MSFLRQLIGKRVLVASSAIALGIILVSCSESKVTQCNRLVKVANDAVDQVEQVTQNATPDNVEAMSRIAGAADNANKLMTDLQLTDTTLVGFKNQFTTMYSNTSRATRSLIDAAKAKNATAAEQAFKDLQQATSAEEPLVRQVNQYCTTSQ